MTITNDKKPSNNIIEIIKNEISIVSLMLFFATFLFTTNFDDGGGLLAKPLLLFLISALLILYGIIIHISSSLIEKHSSQLYNLFNKISAGFYIFSIIIFVLSCDLLLVAIQGLEGPENLNYHILRIIAMAIVFIPLFLLIISLLYNLKKI